MKDYWVDSSKAHRRNNKDGSSSDKGLGKLDPSANLRVHLGSLGDFRIDSVKIMNLIWEDVVHHLAVELAGAQHDPVVRSRSG